MLESAPEEQESGGDVRELRSLADIFQGGVPRDKAEAYQTIGWAWDRLNATERLELFGTIVPVNVRWSWSELAHDRGIQQVVVEQTLVRVFGDHRPPYTFK